MKAHCARVVCCACVLHMTYTAVRLVVVRRPVLASKDTCTKTTFATMPWWLNLQQPGVACQLQQTRLLVSLDGQAHRQQPTLRIPLGDTPLRINLVGKVHEQLAAVVVQQMQQQEAGITTASTESTFWHFAAVVSRMQCSMGKEGSAQCESVVLRLEGDSPPLGQREDRAAAACHLLLCR